MSVNGDLMVVRNGRSTSQVSVYNYPEHLNPFYEDDNHKRLRFWKINKNSKDGEGRRNSFSLGGLKDMWAFKSFRMKKKSSSLGINKTSESPPPLRRDIYNNDKSYGTYDPRMRYTTQATNGIGSNDPFQRNVPYRSSLQDMRTSQPEQPINGIGFNRNDRYRSTLQTVTSSGTPTQSLTLPPMRRYVYRGSVTPQPKRNLEFNSDSLGMISHGSSQVSVASTNPFDDEDDDDVDVSGISAASIPAKHPTRKKRRAPPPPIPVHQIIKEESSSAGSTPSHKPSTSPPKTSAVQDEKSLEIHNLTAEIENFVNSSNLDDSHEVRSSTIIVTSNSPKRNGTVPKNRNSPTRETNIKDEESSFIREDQGNEESKKVNVEKNNVNEIGQVNLIHVSVDSPRSTLERQEPSGVSSFRSEAKPDLPKKVGKTSSNEVIQITEVTKNVKESHGIIKPPIAAKPNIPKSPPPVSSRSSSIPREVSVVETPDTPAMRRKKIQLVKEASLSPELTHREIGIDIPHHTPAPPRQDVTIQVKRIVVVEENENEQVSADSTPVLIIREQKPTPTERNSSHHTTENSIVTDKILNISHDPKPLQRADVKVNVEESISSLEEDLPTTISELQLKISEVDQVPKLSEEPVNELPQEVERVSALVPVNPAPIVKPQRTKHLVEENGENIYRPRPSQWKQSTLAPLEPVPPEKRRSVNQIIDSINRNQRLLGGARKEDENKIEVNNSQRNESETNTNTMEQNLKSLAESQREMKRMLLELEGLENAHEKKLSNKTDENFQGILDTIVSTLAKDTSKNSNGDVFKKCTITKEVSNASRESSPTSSNIDWNPVPKPKRTNKNLSPELQLKKKNNEY